MLCRFASWASGPRTLMAASRPPYPLPRLAMPCGAWPRHAMRRARRGLEPRCLPVTLRTSLAMPRTADPCRAQHCAAMPSRARPGLEPGCMPLAPLLLLALPGHARPCIAPPSQTWPGHAWVPRARTSVHAIHPELPLAGPCDAEPYQALPCGALARTGGVEVAHAATAISRSSSDSGTRMCLPTRKWPTTPSSTSL